jgi:hypothetical protein
MLDCKTLKTQCLDQKDKDECIEYGKSSCPKTCDTWDDICDVSQVACKKSRTACKVRRVIGPIILLVIGFLILVYMAIKGIKYIQRRVQTGIRCQVQGCEEFKVLKCNDCNIEYCVNHMKTHLDSNQTHNWNRVRNTYLSSIITPDGYVPDPTTRKFVSLRDKLESEPISEIEDYQNNLKLEQQRYQYKPGFSMIGNVQQSQILQSVHEQKTRERDEQLEDDRRYFAADNNAPGPQN